MEPEKRSVERVQSSVERVPSSVEHVPLFQALCLVFCARAKPLKNDEHTFTTNFVITFQYCIVCQAQAKPNPRILTKFET